MPVISSMIPFNSQYRLISFVTTLGSRPMCYSVSRYSNSAHGHSHNCVGFDIADFSSMDCRLPRDVYYDNQGVPVEIGFGHLLSFEYESNSAHPSATAGISSLTYELTLILCQLKTFVSCHLDLKHHYMRNLDLSSCYEAVDKSLVQLSLRIVSFMPINDAYETLIRFISGADQHDAIGIKAVFAIVSDHFQDYMTKSGQAYDYGRDYQEYTQTFRMHRLVSITMRLYT